MKIHSGALLVIAMIVFIAGCAGTGPVPQGDNADAMQALSLTIKSPVKATVPYPAAFICTMPKTGVDNVKGYFFWNQEGPFEYPLQKYEDVQTKQGKQPRLTFFLYTGRPDTYTISGYLVYREITTGKMGKTEKISAGPVTVK